MAFMLAKVDAFCGLSQDKSRFWQNIYLNATLILFIHSDDCEFLLFGCPYNYICKLPLESSLSLVFLQCLSINYSNEIIVSKSDVSSDLAKLWWLYGVILTDEVGDWLQHLHQVCLLVFLDCHGFRVTRNNAIERMTTNSMTRVTKSFVQYSVIILNQVLTLFEILSTANWSWHKFWPAWRIKRISNSWLNKIHFPVDWNER